MSLIPVRLDASGILPGICPQVVAWQANEGRNRWRQHRSVIHQIFAQKWEHIKILPYCHIRPFVDQTSGVETGGCAALWNRPLSTSRVLLECCSSEFKVFLCGTLRPSNSCSSTVRAQQGLAWFGLWVVRNTALGLRFPYVYYTPWSPWHGRSGFFHALCSTVELLTWLAGAGFLFAERLLWKHLCWMWCLAVITITTTIVLLIMNTHTHKNVYISIHIHII